MYCLETGKLKLDQKIGKMKLYSDIVMRARDWTCVSLDRSLGGPQRMVGPRTMARTPVSCTVAQCAMPSTPTQTGKKKHFLPYFLFWATWPVCHVDHTQRTDRASQNLPGDKALTGRALS